MSKRILVVRLSSLGDVVNAIPTLVALRKAMPDAFLGMAVESRFASLLQGHPLLNRLEVIPRPKLNTALSCKTEKYDIVIDLQGSLKGIPVVLASKAKQRIGFVSDQSRELSHLFSNTRVRAPHPVHRAVKFLHAIEPLGIKIASPEYVLPPRPPRVLSGKYVIMHPGTSKKGEIKRWQPEKFRELAKFINSKFGFEVYLSWSASDLPLVEEIAARGDCEKCPETKSILQLAAEIEGAQAFISADTGPLHIANALKVRSLSLFGPKDPAVYAPFQGPSVVLFNADGAKNITLDSARLWLENLLDSKVPQQIVRC